MFPVLFPVCSHSRPVNPLSSQCSGFSGLKSMDGMPSSSSINSTTKNTGNSGNTVETARIGLGSHVEQIWNSGNKPDHMYPTTGGS